MSLSFYKWISISTEILRNCLRSAEKKARILNTADSHCTEIRTSSNINKQTTIDKRGRINLSYWNLCIYNDIGRVRVCDGAWLKTLNTLACLSQAIMNLTHSIYLFFQIWRTHLDPNTWEDYFSAVLSERPPTNCMHENRKNQEFKWRPRRS